MSLWAELSAGIRKLLLMQELLDRLDARTRAIETMLDDHAYRLVRIETIIELATRRLEKD